MRLKDFLRDNWPSVTIAITVGVIACAFLFLLWNMPPRVIVMATGAEGGTYYELGKRYQALLARDNIEVRLMPTAGSAENVAKLRDPKSGVGAAFVQGGTIGPDAKSDLESLGTIFYEPYWQFRRQDLGEVGGAGLVGRKISIGSEGSGTRELSLRLLPRVGISEKNATLLALTPRETAEQLLAGKVDAAFLIAAWESPVVQQLIADDRIALGGYPRADAFVALFPFMTKLILPRGAADLLKDKPPADLTLIGSKASLIVRDDLHPALQYALLNAAAEIHSTASIFSRANTFPEPEATDVPLSSEATRFHKSGLPILNQYFPFWMAELVGKMAILLIPILGILYPMMRFLPGIYDWTMRSKVLRLYGELRLLEDAALRAGETGGESAEIKSRLENLEQQVSRVRLPVAYSSLLYNLRAHIRHVRETL
jgi:TRAP-type uncharacterized transport system substrate-binding protein